MEPQVTKKKVDTDKVWLTTLSLGLAVSIMLAAYLLGKPEHIIATILFSIVFLLPMSIYCWWTRHTAITPEQSVEIAQKGSTAGGG